MSRKYGISLCHISYLNFQCIFEFDKNDFACKGHMVLTNDSRFIKIKHDHLIYTLDRTASDYLDFLFLKLPLTHFHGSRTSLQSRGAVINYHQNCKFMSNHANNHKVSWGGGGQLSFIRVKFCVLYPTSFSSTIPKVKVLATISQKCY